MKAQAQQDAEAALAEPLDVYRSFFLDGSRSSAATSPSIADIRLAATLEFLRGDRLRLPGLGARSTWRAMESTARRRLLRAGAGRARLHRLRQVAERLTAGGEAPAPGPPPAGRGGQNAPA